MLTLQAALHPPRNRARLRHYVATEGCPNLLAATTKVAIRRRRIPVTPTRRNFFGITFSEARSSALEA
jgi:hypothetical protein